MIWVGAMVSPPIPADSARTIKDPETARMFPSFLALHLGNNDYQIIR